jgi:Peptide-N-glycosidase F, C terminal
MRAMRWQSVVFLVAVGFWVSCSSSPAKPKLPQPYSEPVFASVVISSHSEDPNFQNAYAMVDFHDAPFSAATLIVDLTSPCYPFDNWATDAPPSGQNWPADCDAFDRNFEITIEDDTADNAIELMRAITPFGGPEHQELDITDVANGLPGMHKLRVNIPTYSDSAGMVSGSHGQWTVNATLMMTPGAAPRTVLAVQPLFNLSQEAASPPPVAQIEVPAGTVSSRIEYRATGHGGAMDTSKSCIGPAEEFCKRTHHVLLDGNELMPGLIPWRTDCTTLCTPATFKFPAGNTIDYCMENPCGATSSVKAPRANWCPGSLTPPLTWDGPTDAGGTHALTYTIDGEYPGGVWRLSAVYFAFGN